MALCAFAVVLAAPNPIPTAEPLSIGSRLDERDIAGFYNSVSFDVISFYEDYINNRYSYLNSYQSFFLTHSFSAGSVASQFSAIVTYTDDSFTTMFASSPALETALASLATQFPWYSSWTSAHASSTATASANAAAERNLPAGISRSGMNLMLCVMVFMSSALFLVVL